jgi:hypothetical protein
MPTEPTQIPTHCLECGKKLLTFTTERRVRMNDNGLKERHLKCWKEWKERKKYEMLNQYYQERLDAGLPLE